MATDTRFTPGDIVRLKSGGPAMTVASAEYPETIPGQLPDVVAPRIWCVWMGEGAVTASTEQFNPLCLVKSKVK